MSCRMIRSSARVRLLAIRIRMLGEMAVSLCGRMITTRVMMMMKRYVEFRACCPIALYFVYILLCSIRCECDGSRLCFGIAMEVVQMRLLLALFCGTAAIAAV